MKKRMLVLVSLILFVSTATVLVLNTTKVTKPNPIQLTEVTATNEPRKTESEKEVKPVEQTNSDEIQPSSTPAPNSAPRPNPAQNSVPVPKPKLETQLSSEKQRMLDLINAERGKVGIAPLSADVKVLEVAQIKSSDMVKNNYFSHTSPTYGSPFDMLRKFGVAFSGAAENIARNSSVEAAHTALMASEGHRKNLLNTSYNYIGIGITDSPSGKVFVQMFIKK